MSSDDERYRSELRAIRYATLLGAAVCAAVATAIWIGWLPKG